MKLINILIEAYKDLKADKLKDPDKLITNGWIKIPKKDGRMINNVIHVTDQKGVDDIMEHLEDWQISSLNKGKIGKVGDRVIVFNGFLNKTFIGDGATVVGSDGCRYYKPENVTPNADYDELIVIPLEIVKVYDVSKMGDVIKTNDIYKQLHIDKLS